MQRKNVFVNTLPLKNLPVSLSFTQKLAGSCFFFMWYVVFRSRWKKLLFRSFQEPIDVNDLILVARMEKEGK